MAAKKRRTYEPLLSVVVVFMVAVAARLVPVLRGGGLDGLSFYDDGVHFSAATGFVHGQMPYRDFLLLHPPGILLALAPFAELARWTGDATAFAVARVAFMVLGGVNAVLVSRLLRPTGRYGAWLGGLVYAVFWPAVYIEHTVLLEGLANTLLFLTLLLAVPLRRSEHPSTAKLLVAGGLLGMTAGIKIWGVVPVLILFGWLIFSARIRRAAVFLVGAAIGCTLVCLPFFVLAPSQMWRMVVVDQVQRNNGGLRSVERMNQILGLTLYNPPSRLTAALVVLVLLMVAATIVAWTQWRVRPVVLLMLGLGAMLMVTPSWFLHYTALTAGPIAITIGAAGQQAVSWAGARGWRPVQLGVAGALVLGLLAASAPIAPARVGQRFPGRTLAAAMAPRPGCITTDNASTLILTNTLSRNLDRGCQLVADLGGASYHLDSPARGVVSRQKNAVFQQYALAYLRTGQTTILVRFRRGFGLSSSSYDIVQHWPVVARAGRYVLRAPRP